MRKLLGRKASSGFLQCVLLTWKLSLWYVAPLHDPQTFEFCRNQCLLTVTLNVSWKTSGSLLPLLQLHPGGA